MNIPSSRSCQAACSAVGRAGRGIRAANEYEQIRMRAIDRAARFGMGRLSPEPSLLTYRPYFWMISSLVLPRMSYFWPTFRKAASALSR